ncbi:MAG: tetratricopeptide repeat protein [Tissierellaceae bacterium]|nr:tetratricopeptide repeat protein [Tissierellaceae bacterium]
MTNDYNREYKAVKVFTDRKESRDAFWAAFNYMKDNNNQNKVKVLNYYGIGGIGKSRLTSQLRKELREKEPYAKFVYFDFETEIEVHKVLYKIIYSLKMDYNFSFDLTEIALYYYHALKGEKIEKPGDNKILPINSEIEDILGPIIDNTYLGNVIKTIKALDAGIAKLIKIGFNYENKKEIKLIQSYEQRELKDKLSYYFAMDLKRNLESCNYPFVFFLETYEKLIKELNSAGYFLSNDEWLRKGIITNNPGILWVISGRDMLKWKIDNNQSIQIDIEQHKLGDLSLEDSSYFLKNAMVDEHFHEDIFKITKGLPLHLDLCVDIDWTIKNQGGEPKLEDFEGEFADLAQRFLLYMNDEEKDLVHILACLGSWDDEEILDLSDIFKISATSYDKMVGLSFIITEDNTTYYIHKKVEEVLNQICPKLIRLKFIKYIKDQLNNNKISKNDRLKLILRRIKVNGIYEKEEGLYEIVKTIKDDLISYIVDYDHNTVRRILEPLWKLVQEYKGSSVYVITSYYYAEYLKGIGELQQANKIITECSSYYNQVGLSKLEILEYESTKASIVSKLGDKKQALEIRKEIYEEIKELLEESDLSRIKALYNLGRAYSSVNEMDNAILAGKEAYKQYRDQLGNENAFTLKAMQTLGGYYKKAEHYEEAYTLLIEAYNIHKDYLGEDHPQTLIVLRKLAFNYEIDSHKICGLNMRKEIYEKCYKKLGEDHPLTISCYEDLGYSYYSYSMYEEALNVYQSVYEKYKEDYGVDNPRVDRVKKNMNKSKDLLTKYNERVNTSLKAYKDKLAEFGEGNIETIKAYEEIGNSYLYLGKYSDAEGIYETVYSQLSSLFGEGNDDTKQALINLRSAYYMLEKYDEALKIMLKAHESLKNELGADYPDALKNLNLIVDAYEDLGMHDKGIVYVEEMLSILAKQQGRENFFAEH